MPKTTLLVQDLGSPIRRGLLAKGNGVGGPLAAERAEEVTDRRCRVAKDHPDREPNTPGDEQR